ncbi:AGAP010313-PA-like protein [Anopheles sinensis]|uniref:AGAP010313-PA-like protein n=1 Tax=Anopheles sinensis TaxID=74873 RepID=A0A084VB78_ANOSI|nr:AGAP010313-PA-like protein [Anopheles sinensis]
MFVDTEPDSPRRSDQPIHGETSENDGVRSIAKREMLPRSSKINSRPLLPDSPEEKRKLKFTKKVVASRVDCTHCMSRSSLKSCPIKRSSCLRRNCCTFAVFVAYGINDLSLAWLDFPSLTKEEILDMFGRYRKDLLEIFVRWTTIKTKLVERASRDTNTERTDPQAWLNVQNIEERLKGYVKINGKPSCMPLSIEGQVNHLIKEATDTDNLAQMYIGWSGYT